MTNQRIKKTKEKIFSCIKGMFAFEYQDSKGNWLISKIAKDSGTSRTSVYKYINIKA
ncbi:MAG: hypothetical protein AB7S49_04035 [Arcobacter sp.]|uniref:hypothetical protein n=1 Tax=Arcobacter sp. TaxID=1872629 RepID=UPI003D03CD54